MKIYYSEVKTIEDIKKTKDYLLSQRLEFGYADNHTFIAQSNENIVGVISLHDNDFHPYTKGMFIYVQKNFRRQGIGTKLYELFVKAKEIKVRVGVKSNDLGLTSFLEYIGLRKEIECYLTKYSLNNLTLQNFNENKIVTTKVADLSAVMLNDLYNLIYDDYKALHTYNPVSSKITLENFIQVALKNYDPKHSFVIIDEKILGYVISFPIDDTTIEAGYVGGLNISKNRLKRGFIDIFRKLFNSFEIIEFEIDSNNKVGLMALELFDNFPNESWNVYFNTLK